MAKTNVKLDNILLKNKFKGALWGCLVGDCLGGPFEGDVYSPGMLNTVQKCFDKLDGPYFKSPYRSYSDDTAMTKCIAKTLIEKPPVDYPYMAKQFVKEYFDQPNRGYGMGAVEVFHKLRDSKFLNIYQPAKEQFDGTGSYGNGGAMRIAPIALYFHSNYEAMIDAAIKSTEITHTHKLGVNGALLQCIAVNQSLNIDPNTGELDVHAYVDELIKKIKVFENYEKKSESEAFETYEVQLQMVQRLLRSDTPENPVKIEEIIVALGNTVSALFSVPTAIYCFLKAHLGCSEVNSTNFFRRAIQYAVSLGGDTDTIAAMAGAISGAHYGDNIISENFLKHCEAPEEIGQMAEHLFQAASDGKPLKDLEGNGDRTKM